MKKTVFVVTLTLTIAVLAIAASRINTSSYHVNKTVPELHHVKEDSFGQSRYLVNSGDLK